MNTSNFEINNNPNYYPLVKFRRFSFISINLVYISQFRPKASASRNYKNLRDPKKIIYYTFQRS